MFRTQALHFNTFGGNPMASAVGIAVLDTIKEDGLQENSATLGKIFEIMDHNGHPVSC